MLSSNNNSHNKIEVSRRRRRFCLWLDVDWIGLGSKVQVKHIVCYFDLYTLQYYMVHGFEYIININLYVFSVPEDFFSSLIRVFISYIFFYFCIFLMGIITSMLCYICACEYMIRVVDFPVKLVDRSIDRSRCLFL